MILRASRLVDGTRTDCCSFAGVVHLNLSLSLQCNVYLLEWLSIPEPQYRLDVCKLSGWVQVFMETDNPTEMVGSYGLLLSAEGGVYISVFTLAFQNS